MGDIPHIITYYPKKDTLINGERILGVLDANKMLPWKNIRLIQQKRKRPDYEDSLTN